MQIYKFHKCVFQTINFSLLKFRAVSLIGGQNNGLNSQMVRQGLRQVVSGRQAVGNGSAANNGIRRSMGSPMDTLGVDGNANPNNPNTNANLMINQQQQLPNSMINTDMDASMRFNFDMPQGEY